MDNEAKPRILLVDDEAALTKLMQTYLSRLGYVADMSFDAAGAFKLAEEATQPYDVLVTDLTLPDLPGEEVALRLLEENPELRVLLCSGYPVTVESLPEKVQIRCSSLLKPFLPNMLVQSIDDLLKRKIKKPDET